MSIICTVCVCASVCPSVWECLYVSIICTVCVCACVCPVCVSVCMCICTCRVHVYVFCLRAIEMWSHDVCIILDVSDDEVANEKGEFQNE